jgi:AAA15 family ATPase/GTPase
MDIIDKIEIRHFRSFDGGTGQPRVLIQDLGDLNVFSGANDSGKSNVLRALNLFFNNEISPGVRFEKERDFSKIVSMRFDEKITEKREAGQDWKA